MSYTPTTGDCVTASWVGDSACTPIAGDAVTASWEQILVPEFLMSASLALPFSVDVSFEGGAEFSMPAPVEIGVAAGPFAFGPTVAGGWVEQMAIAVLAHPGVVAEQMAVAVLAGATVTVEQMMAAVLTYYPPIQLTGSVSSVLGASRGRVYAGETAVSGRVARVLGVAHGTVECPGLVVFGRIPSLVHAVGRAANVRQVSGSASQLLRGRGVLKSLGDPWAAAGLPLPSLEGYSLTADRGLVRTKMASGRYLQRRRWSSGYDNGTLKFVVDRGQLNALYSLLDDVNYGWMNMLLVSEQSPTSSVSLHLVRMVSGPRVSGLFGDNLEVILEVEVQ